MANASAALSTSRYIANAGPAVFTCCPDGPRTPSAGVAERQVDVPRLFFGKHDKGRYLRNYSLAAPFSMAQE